MINLNQNEEHRDPSAQQEQQKDSGQPKSGDNPAGKEGHTGSDPLEVERSARHHIPPDATIEGGRDELDINPYGQEPE